MFVCYIPSPFSKPPHIVAEDPNRMILQDAQTQNTFYGQSTPMTVLDRSDTTRTLAMGGDSREADASKVMDKPLWEVLFIDESDLILPNLDLFKPHLKVWVDRRKVIGDVNDLDPDMALHLKTVIENGDAYESLIFQVDTMKTEHAQLKTKWACAAESMKQVQYKKIKEQFPDCDPEFSEVYKTNVLKIVDWQTQKNMDLTRKMAAIESDLKDLEVKYDTAMEHMINAAKNIGLSKRNVELPDQGFMAELLSILEEPGTPCVRFLVI